MFSLTDATTGSNKENIYCRHDDHKSVESVTHGMGKRSLSAEKVTDDLKNKRRKLENCDKAAVLQRQVSQDLLQLFCIRKNESHRLKWGYVFLKKDPTTGKESLALKARCGSKPHQVFLPVAQTSTDPGTSQCPVQTYKEFESHRPEEMKELNSPFFLAVKEKRRPEDPVWYMKRALGQKKFKKLFP